MAIQLAASRATHAGPEPVQYLTFTVGKELFGLGILAVKEIIEYQGVTPVPMMPAAVCGVINRRGSVVPVLDLSLRLGSAPTNPSKRSCIVIVEQVLLGEPQVIGVLVDAVDQVIEIPASEVEPPPSFGTKIRHDFMLGLGKVNGRFVVLLDAGHVLSLEQAEALSELGECPP